MSKASIKQPSIGIRPSSKLIDFIKTLDDPALDLPENLLKVYQAFSQDTRPRNVCKPADASVGAYSEDEKQLLVTLSDDTFQGATDLEKTMKSLSVLVSGGSGDDDDSHNSDVETLAPDERISKNKARQIRAKQRQKELAKLALNLADLKWLQTHLNDARQKAADDAATPYLHELVDGSQLILPPNEIVQRDPALEARCQRLKIEQDEQQYRQMTKNVDCTRTFEAEETLSYQGKPTSTACIFSKRRFTDSLSVLSAHFSYSQANESSFDCRGTVLIFGGRWFCVRFRGH